MTDINARINWQPGMQITAQTMKEMAESLDFKQRMMNLIANNNRIGILPQTEFCCHGSFYKNILEINNFKCRAILPSGRITDADENISIKIPILYGETYYLTISFGEGQVSYEKEEVAFVRPQYLYEIHTLEEIEKGDYLPLLKFRVSEGMFNITPNYIAPTLLISSNEKYKQFLDIFIEKLQLIATHANLKEGEGKQCLQKYLFTLKSCNPQESTHHFMQLLQEIAHAIDYHVVSTCAQHTTEIPTVCLYDVEEWLTWFGDYLDSSKNLLDGFVLKEDHIDYEKLKQEITADVYERTYQQVYERLKKEILEKFNPDMEEQIKATLTQYLNEVMRQEISNQLKDELSTALYDKLYQILYDALYAALYVEEEEEEEEQYIPQI